MTTASSQVSTQVDQQAQFNVQTQFSGIIEQLERLERVADGVQREHSVKRNKTGDMNHQTVADNEAAMNTRLMAFNITQKFYGGGFQGSCTEQLLTWCRLRSHQPSPAVLQAVCNTLRAINGTFTYSPPSVNLTEEQLGQYASMLATATANFHHKQEHFERDPQAWTDKPRDYRVEFSSGGTTMSVEQFQQVYAQPPQAGYNGTVPVAPGYTGQPEGRTEAFLFCKGSCKACSRNRWHCEQCSWCVEEYLKQQEYERQEYERQESNRGGQR